MAVLWEVGGGTHLGSPQYSTVSPRALRLQCGYIYGYRLQRSAALGLQLYALSLSNSWGERPLLVAPFSTELADVYALGDFAFT